MTRELSCHSFATVRTPSVPRGDPPPAASKDSKAASPGDSVSPRDESVHPRDESVTITRRSMLGGSAAAIAAAYTAHFKATPVGRYLEGVTTRVVTELPKPHSTGQTPIPFRVERDSDLLLLDITFYDFNLDTSTSPVTLVPLSSSNLIYVQFAPQAIGEGVYPLPPGSFDPPPILSVLSGPSQLVFTIADLSPIPLTTMTVDDLLDWSDWTLLVPDVATVTDKPQLPTYPEGNSTLIECPYALYLSPVVNPTVSGKAASGRGNAPDNGGGVTRYVTSFSGTVQPSSPIGVTECWAATLTYTEVTRLTSGGTLSTPLEPLVSAVWSRDLSIYCQRTGTFDFLTSFTIPKKYWATPSPDTTTIPSD